MYVIIKTSFLVLYLHIFEHLCGSLIITNNTFGQHSMANNGRLCVKSPRFNTKNIEISTTQFLFQISYYSLDVSVYIK